MSDPLFWQLGFIVLQEALVATALGMGVYLLIRSVWRGLENASQAAKARRLTALQPAVAQQSSAPADPVAVLQ